VGAAQPARVGSVFRDRHCHLGQDNAAEGIAAGVASETHRVPETCCGGECAGSTPVRIHLTKPSVAAFIAM
jgi:hypothetical protein